MKAGISYTEISENYDMVLKFVRNGKIFYRGQLKELKGKNWAFPDKKSMSGYILPLFLFHKLGIDVDTFFNYKYEAGSHDKAIELLLRGNVQIATTFEDVRERLVDKYPDIFQKTKILYYTDSIPNDGFAINKSIKKKDREKIIRAIKELVLENKTLSYDWFGSYELVEAKNSDYDVLKEIFRSISDKISK
ncbi:MAG: PhnD/SsuA/transferrin family substrate-binding protein [candidate division WOR-3 bacterium]